MQLPTITFQELYHVGTMKKENKKKGSLEGSGVSVSVHPNEWLRIARLGEGTLYKLTKSGHKLLNYYELTDEQKREIIRWGIEKGYILSQLLYRVEYYDDEIDSDLYSDYTDEEEAEIEAEGYEVDIVQVAGYVALETMKNKVMHDDIPPILVESLLTTLFVEEVTALDGVWWNECLDVSVFSAPRGVIHSSCLKTWHIELVDIPYTRSGWEIESIKAYCPSCESFSLETLDEDGLLCQNPNCKDCFLI